jgi:hypothetical protein
MGEAKRRHNLALEYSTPRHHADIARVVRSIDFITGSGTCFVRALLGAKVLGWLGIPSRLTHGAMLYRAGPDPIADVIAFCGPGNAADGPRSHDWLTVGDDLVDFSVGDWRPLSDLEWYGRDHLPPIQWTASALPDFWWRPKSMFLNAWRQRGEPQIGEAWYAEARLPEEEARKENIDAARDPVRWAEIVLRDRAKQLIADWQTGTVTEFPKKHFVLGGAVMRNLDVLNFDRTINLSVPASS